MITNPGFLVQYDRFSLTEWGKYMLRGYMVPGVVLTAKLRRQEVPVSVDAVTDNTDERYGGYPATVTLRFTPEDLMEDKVRMKAAGKLRIYAAGDRGKRLVFEISAASLLEKMRGIRYYIDDYTVSRKDGFFRVTGWAVAKEPVLVRVYDAEGTLLKDAVERYRRLDTVDLFDEFPVEEMNGFNVEIRPVPKGDIRIRLTTPGGEETVLRYATGKTAYGAARAGALMGKAVDAFRMNGPAALAIKTYNKLFNPAMRKVHYADWIKKHMPSDRVLAMQSKKEFPVSPLISIVVPCYKTPEKYLLALVDSVKDQSYANWELILSDGSGEDSPMRQMLDDIARDDGRIRVLHNGRQLGISANTNAAIREAKGEWTAFADHDDLIAPSALYEFVSYINDHPDVELIYSDEDKIGTGGQLMQPNMKPDFNPDFLCSVNYICHMTAVKKEALDRVSRPGEEGAEWFDPAFDGAQDHDLLLRLSETTDRIGHIPKILYHWRFFEGSTAANPESKTWAFEAGRRAVASHYSRLGLPAEVVCGEYPGLYRTIWHWDEKPKVSVIIPNKDHIGDLRKCLTSMNRCVSWPELEILVIENNSEEKETFEAYKDLEKEDPRIRVLYYEGSFNYSAINNFGAKNAEGDYLLLLNNDTEFITDAVTEMMGFVMRRDVGAAGARLYYGDDTIQHAGAIIGWGGVAGHAFVNQKRGESGYQHRIICQMDLSAVTAACMLVRRDVFDQVGGFTEELAVAFNDIDLCMKIRDAGYLIVYDPFAELYHYESKSRGLENTPEKKSRFGKELKYFQKKWPEILRDGDPYYSPNLSMITQDFSLRRI